MDEPSAAGERAATEMARKDISSILINLPFEMSAPCAYVSKYIGSEGAAAKEEHAY
jgi:hypothetical protein